VIPLFQYFPRLEEKLPHISLAQFPTPVINADKLRHQLNIKSLLIKEDNVSGEIYGGNKIRKLEFHLGQALKKRKEKVLTFGCAGSNHALATALYAQQQGLQCISMLLHQPNAHYVGKNLLMHYQSGAELHSCQNNTSMHMSAFYQLIRHKLKTGSTPLVIPTGGTSPLGTAGYVNAAFELRDQIQEGIISEPDVIYVALGTMGTAVGLLLGLRAANLKTCLIAVRVVYDNIANPARFMTIFQQTNHLLHSMDPSFPIVEISIKDFVIRNDFFGEHYALFTYEGMKAVDLCKKTEGMHLEGTYTGKTFAAVIHDARKGDLKNKNVMFWNTYNSRNFLPCIHGIDYHSLPKNFHRYFENNVQPLDTSETLQ